MDIVDCSDCEYYDVDEDRCTYLICDGLDCEECPKEKKNGRTHDRGLVSDASTSA